MTSNTNASMRPRRLRVKFSDLSEADQAKVQELYAEGVLKIFAVMDSADYILLEAYEELKRCPELYKGDRAKRAYKAVRTSDKVKEYMRIYIEDHGNWIMAREFLEEWQKYIKPPVQLLVIAYKQALDKYNEPHAYFRSLAAVTTYMLVLAEEIRTAQLKVMAKVNNRVAYDLSIITMKGVRSHWAAATDDLGRSEHDILNAKGVQDAYKNLARTITKDAFNQALTNAVNIIENEEPIQEHID